ncbi:MAG: cupin domain-containing protein [Thermoleophilia bacterium]|nr:cupin domain-containing protein [Thermoleophilia bacterium]
MRLLALGTGLTRSDAAIFDGDVDMRVHVGEDDAELFRVAEVSFHDGGRTTWHVHEADQLLVVTAGSGIAATESEEIALSPGAVVLVPAGERHWHGAAPGASLTHLSVLTPGAMHLG